LIFRGDLPTTTTRVGAKAWQIFSITALESDLPPPAAKGCKQNKRRIGIEARRWIAAWNLTAESVPDLPAGQLGQFDVTFDSVFAAIHFCHSMIKKSRAFAAIAHSVNFFRAANFCDERACGATLGIESEVGRSNRVLFTE